MSDPASQVSAASISGSSGPGCVSCGSASPTEGCATCCPNGSLRFPATRTFERSLGKTGPSPLISSAEDFPARTSASPDDGRDSSVSDQDCSSNSHGSLTLFGLDGLSSRTYPGCSAATAVGTLDACLERWPTSGTAWRGGFSTAVSSECHSDEDGCSSSEPVLTGILQEPHTVPDRYSLSARAAKGILARASVRGRALPTPLQVALENVSRRRMTTS